MRGVKCNQKYHFELWVGVSKMKGEQFWEEIEKASHKGFDAHGFA